MFHNRFKFVKISCQCLFSDEGLLLPLIIDWKLNSAWTKIIFARAMFKFRSNTRVIARKTNKLLWSNNSVSEVRFHFDKTSFTDISLTRSETDNAWSLSKVSLVGNDFDSTSLGNSNLTLIRTEINSYGGRVKLFFHLLYMIQM